MASIDPTYAKFVLPSLQGRTEVACADDLFAPFDKLESHMSSQLMKAVATLATSSATKRAQGGKNGSGAGDK